MMRRRIRFAAVLVVVVLALTGFQTAGHGGKSGKSGKSRSGGSSSGGGCSNSEKSNGDYHSDNDYDSGSSGSSGGSYSTPTPSATASDAPAIRVIRCAQPKKGKRKAVTSSTIEIRSTAAGTHLYEIDVTFLGATGLTVDTGEGSVELDGGETKTLTVRMDSPRSVSRVKRCQVTAELSY
ncbi:hypothetical protein CP967_14090 [Streptomyces nitrosporeus]|uniref:Uncharacterized protein n=1 Tax=Streptomyces nitrosporeus TaxID=28894 RepID=A0A5J6FB56_9ACTN|nr:hypothetical protein [Streptomyces nitrosporeus]QEU72987.1 hypothetical protein CP967_14090 [Streptomyces nitrosporeus]GGZ14194.1 hypothetical protein GCM10010327_51500 [Streptomyces nitrosporeus]